ncbi:hypothetical protein [Devosia nitrariae]|uniref:Uncharacterized protein n=1 Tax=Devosia nitrariae TaxID=2071872 RepID=A0ABQ5W5U3_9HYPH|nr:hypothetical protein [Devosia nitrariae]GLQ55445.1 hypothetical protein GCM10010862_27040 [Devosia nitrariae]
MDHSIFLASYVVHLANREAFVRKRSEEQYFLEQADFDTGDLVRRLVVAVAIISLSFSSLIVVAGYAAPEVREQTVLRS